MKSMTKDEWFLLGRKLYGEEIEDWKVRCPMCGRVNQLIEFKEAGSKSPDDAFVECIGRYTGQGSPDKADGNGCNWAAYGLFGIPRAEKYEIVFGDGNTKQIFPFADDPDLFGPAAGDGKEDAL